VSLSCAFKKAKETRLCRHLKPIQGTFDICNTLPNFIKMVLAGGGQLTRRQHLLSRDGRQLLVCRANSIRVYSTATAELLFEMQGHLDEVTCMCLHPKSSTQVRKEIQIMILQKHVCV